MNEKSAPNARIDAWCLGETMAQVTPTDGRRLDTAETFQVSAGGAESNVAIGLAQLGRRAAWQSRVGVDPFGSRLLREIERFGVDVSAVTRDPNRQTGLYAKDPTPAGTRVYYYRSGSAASLIGHAEARRALRAAPRLIHLSGITPALSSSSLGACRAILHRAARSGTQVSFDVNYRPVLWPDRARAARVLSALASMADIVLVGRDEATSLWGTDSAEDVRRMLPRPPRLIVKDGGINATAFTPDGTFIEPAPAIEVVEPVGGGDAFASGWLHGLLGEMPEPVRLRLGHLMAGRALASVSDLSQSPIDIGGLEAAALAGWSEHD